MKEKEWGILNLFRKKPLAVLSTAEILKSIEPKYDEFEKIIRSSPWKEKIAEAKREIAKLHRQYLYYLAKLTKGEILKLEKIGEKGEKFFSLNLQEGEELILPYHRRRIIFSKPKTPLVPIEGYEKENIISRLEPSSWLEKFNSLLIRINDWKEFEEKFPIYLSSVNDALAIDGFAPFLKKEFFSFAESLSKAAYDFDRLINFIVDLDKVDDPQRFLSQINYLLSLKNFFIVFEINLRRYQEKSYQQLLKSLLEAYLQQGKTIYLKNKDYPAPYFLGKAGPYTFDLEEWPQARDLIEKTPLACSQATLILDAGEFLNTPSINYHQFREIINKIINSFLIFNSHQRRQAPHLFKPLFDSCPENKRNIFIFSRNYFRLWNYGWLNEKVDQALLIDFLSQIRKKVDEFCFHEETIFKSCGMPTRFRVAFSSLLQPLPNFSAGKYKKLVVNEAKDLLDEKMLSSLETKEHLFNIFNGGDCLSLYQENPATREMVKEINLVFSTYKIPFLRMNFKKTQGQSLIDYLK